MASLQEYASAPDPSYLQGQKRSQVRRKRPRRDLGRRAWKIALAASLLSGAAWSLGAAVQFGLYDSRFHLASLYIQGGKFVTRTEVEEKFSPDQGRSVLLAPLAERRRQIERIPWVRSATVRRVLPNQLWVAVRERVPVAFLWRPGSLALVDEEGVILELPEGASFTFPMVRGVSHQDSPAARRSKMQLFAALLQDMNRGGSRRREEISEVDLEDPQDARVVVADSSGAILLHLGREKFLSRYLIYASRIREWKRQFQNIQSIDLRYDRQVVINADPQAELPLKKQTRLLPADSPPVTPPRGTAPAGAAVPSSTPL